MAMKKWVSFTFCARCGKSFRAVKYGRKQPPKKFCGSECYWAAKSGVEVIPAKDRLLSKVTREPSGCIVFTGTRDKNGYGVLSSSHGEKCKHTLAHRLAWTLENGPIPGGKLVLHRCDNPPCVNVEHLFLGAHADNTADKVSKGRQAAGPTSWAARHPESVRRGDKHYGVKISDRDVPELIRLRGDGATLKELAARYGISQSSVSMIARGLKRAHRHPPL